MVLGWLCGGHAGLRPRLEHQEHGFDKSNFCFENLPNMTDFPNHRCLRLRLRLRPRQHPRQHPRLHQRQHRPVMQMKIRGR